MLGFFLIPLSWIYGIAIAVRNWLYDEGVLKSVSVDIPVVCVGNLTVGGTGKTPMCETLIAHFQEKYSVGLISRGYGRRTKGYREVTPGTSWRSVGDEPRQIKTNYPDTVVVVCKDRIEGIRRMLSEHPEVNLIIMDDGFQYRRLTPKINIVMMDYTRPIYKDRLLPAGRLRDGRRQMRRAHYVVVTKCPVGMTPLDRRIARNNLELLPFQNLSFTRVAPEAPCPAFPADASKQYLAPNSQVVAMAGLGNPRPFVNGLRKRYRVAGELLWGDHHPYTVSDLRHMQRALDDAGDDAVIVTTQKDAVKFGSGAKIPPSLRGRIFVQPIKMAFIEESRESFFKKLEYDVRTDQKNSLFYSR
jgi:tetraacyldisaccharide 4'-kinase